MRPETTPSRRNQNRLRESNSVKSTRRGGEGPLGLLLAARMLRVRATEAGTDPLLHHGDEIEHMRAAWLPARTHCPQLLAHLAPRPAASPCQLRTHSTLHPIEPYNAKPETQTRNPEPYPYTRPSASPTGARHPSRPPLRSAPEFPTRVWMAARAGGKRVMSVDGSGAETLSG